MLFWFILGQRKTTLVVFLRKRPLEIILAQKTTELVLIFPLVQYGQKEHHSVNIYSNMLFSYENITKHNS